MRRLLAICFAVVASYSATASTNLLRGLRFHQPPVNLEGSLVFLYGTNETLWSRGPSQIYELDLGSGRLRVVAGAPGGNFYSAEDGRAFCVLFGFGADVRGDYGMTNAFMYSESLNISRSYSFQRCPSQVTFGEGHVFFHFDKRVFDYNMLTESLKPALFPSEASLPGYSETVAVPDKPGYEGFQARNGRWIFFEGRDAPARGTKLVSSALDLFAARSDDPRGKNVQVLKRFLQPLSGSYNLDQVSPNGAYVLIRRSFPMGHRWGYTYYTVNSTNGTTQTLLEDKVCTIEGHGVSEVRWVGRRLPSR